MDGKFYPIQNDNSNSPPSSVLLNVNGTLTISGVKKEHEGVYQCMVSNEVGASLTKSANLRVIGEEKVYIYMDQFPF